MIITVVTILLAADNPSVTGTWKGISKCQIKDSPCKDEVVVYHISKTDTMNSFRVAMNKMLNNKEKEMASQLFIYDEQNQTLTSNDSIHQSKWVLRMDGNGMKGVLVYKNNLYRIVDVKREN